MDAASCGPSNAIQNLSKHTQRDTSLQHQRHQPQPQPQGIHQFRQGQQVDARLNNDFQQFNNGSDFANSFMNQMNMKPNVQQQQHKQQNLQFQQGGWVNDFSNLSIQKKPQQQMKSDWQQQFMQQSAHPMQQQQVQPQQPYLQQMTPNYTTGGYQMRTNLAAPSFQNQTEHQQSHKLEEEQRRFENEFAMIEKHLQAEQQEEQVVGDAEINDIAKEKFAETARKVEDSIKTKTYNDSEMQAKFENSQFLKLMSSIGNRQVELEGDKLVTADSKEDIREKGIPETDAQTNKPFAAAQQINNNENPDYHQPMYDQVPVASTFPIISNEEVEEQTQKEPDNKQENRLPDPLAHILDGQLNDINDPLTAARIISGGQVQMKDWVEDYDRPFRKGQIVDHHWDEMYQDYRHDDDFY
ncbi:hypothetical protein SBY92_003614 [Candida maltosa Xu316]|uniref:Uncharacterized protein n=1 Tax=Candida maltosa (strain Xu316) TaxID=1245528 RepID=M3K4S0_CANMX|nr:hypothetical protein G210_4687 [Candida maltosa Xu316]